MVPALNTFLYENLLNIFMCYSLDIHLQSLNLSGSLSPSNLKYFKGYIKAIFFIGLSTFLDSFYQANPLHNRNQYQLEILNACSLDFTDIVGGNGLTSVIPAIVVAKEDPTDPL